MRFIDRKDHVQVLIAQYMNDESWNVMADFNIPKGIFEDFLDHMIRECKAAYKRDELFSSIKKVD